MHKKKQFPNKLNIVMSQENTQDRMIQNYVVYSGVVLVSLT